MAGRSGTGAARSFAAIGVAMAMVLAGGCAGVRPSREESPKADPVALGVVAEIALERGDCKTASETYAKAAEVSGDAAFARHATLVSLKCEHFPAAWDAAKRWRTLAPNNAEADARYAAVAVKLYHLTEAREAVNDFSHAPPLPLTSLSAKGKGAESGASGDATSGSTASDDAGSASGRTAAAKEEEKPLILSLTALTALLLQQGEAQTVLAAMSNTLEANPSVESTALLSELALSSYDAQRAEHYAQAALQHNPKDPDAKLVLARTYVIRGESAKAIAMARDAIHDDPQQNAFDLAEVLIALDRLEDAHQELERLRSKVPAADIDRRLALLAYEAGDLKEAQQRFAELASNGEANEAALLYLADIAAREGDIDGALGAYRRLYDSSVALQARSRAAALLFNRGDRKEALTLLDDYVTEHSDSEVDLAVTKAHLLADHGEADTAVEVLSTALARHPRHPSIEYERAVILEQAGRVKDSVEVLERLLTERTDDPTMLNALGYTLADHNLELPHAESLIRKALVVMPDSPTALDSLGWVRFRQGDSKAALASLERAYYISRDAEIAAHWGEALWASGDHSQARKVWAAALAREPDSRALKATLARFLPDAK